MPFNILVDCIDLFLDEGIVPAVLPGRVDQSAVREVEDILVLLGEAHRAELGRVELRHLTITSEDTLHVELPKQTFAKFQCPKKKAFLLQIFVDKCAIYTCSYYIPLAISIVS